MQYAIETLKIELAKLKQIERDLFFKTKDSDDDLKVIQTQSAISDIEKSLEFLDCKPGERRLTNISRLVCYHMDSCIETLRTGSRRHDILMPRYQIMAIAFSEDFEISDESIANFFQQERSTVTRARVETIPDMIKTDYKNFAKWHKFFLKECKQFVVYPQDVNKKSLAELVNQS